MFKSLSFLIFWSILFSMVLGLEQTKPSLNVSNLNHQNESFSSHHTLYTVKNYFNKLFNLFKSDNVTNSFYKPTNHIQLEQQNLLNLVKKSNKFNLDHLDYLRIKKFKNFKTFKNETRKSLRTRLNIDLHKTFTKVYKSRYSQFCPCPPRLSNANHNLENLNYDKEDMDCIYLPSTTVEYYCVKGTERKIAKNKLVTNRLVCDLNESTKQLEWIIDVDDKLIDLDESLVYSDRHANDNKFNEFNDRSSNDEELEIRLQSTNLSEFSFQFLQCAMSNEKADVDQETSSGNSFDEFFEQQTIDQLNRRSKRSYSLKRNIEILIVVDMLMNQYHGDNLQNYIYTIMSTVSSIYKDSTIGNNVNIAIVQIILLNEKETKQLISNSASNTLERFCKWQADLNLNRTDDDPLYHDMAILLTRIDLCRTENCDTLGLAHSNKICDTKLSCAIVEDNGLATGLTISHEIAHNLGIPHDQDEKCRRLYKELNDDSRSLQYNIMGKMLDFDSYPFKWSKCSAYFLTDFFDSGKADCLLDSPKRNFLDVVNLNNVTEKEVSKNYEALLKTKSTFDRRVLNVLKNNRIERERRDHRSNIVQTHNRNGRNRNSFLHELAIKKQDLVLPGQYFNTDLQCQLIFGPNSRICPYMTPCKRLWCTSGSWPSFSPAFENEIAPGHNHIQFKRRQETETGCKTQHIPWSEGSSCTNYLNDLKGDYTNDEYWCIKGECLKKELYLANSEKVNGGWSAWSEWSNCTRPCGGGIQTSLRLCNNPEPKNEGAYCIGQRQRYKSCNTFECPPAVIDFRDEQCASFNNKKLKDLPNNVTWKSHLSSSKDDSCKLYCKVETGAYFLLKNKVIDGTDCLENNKCINGLCVQTGCDNMVYSKKVFDACLECGGDNSTCTLVKGKFSQSEVSYGYNHVARIPAGAINILIKQLNGTIDDNNSLALRSFNGSYLVNGNSIISNYERTVWYEGAKIEYSGTGISNDKESDLETIDNQESTNIEDEIERISANEKRLRNEYNSQLNKIKQKRIEYSIDSIHRLYDKQKEIKEYRQRLQELMKYKSTNSFSKFKNLRDKSEVSRVKRVKNRKSFNETIVIRQRLKKDVYLEVLSVGELLRPEIEYQYYLSIDKVTSNKLDDLNLARTDDSKYLKSSKYLSYKEKLLAYEESKLTNQLNIDKLNLKSNDKIILNKLSSNDEIKMNKYKSSNNQTSLSIKTRPHLKTQAPHLRLNLTKNLNKRNNRRAGKNLYGTSQSRTKCSSADKNRTKNCKEISLHFKNDAQVLEHQEDRQTNKKLNLKNKDKQNFAYQNRYRNYGHN